MFRVTTEPLNVQQVNDLVKRPTDGAVVTFDGIVRNNFDGRPVRYLEYRSVCRDGRKEAGRDRCRGAAKICRW